MARDNETTTQSDIPLVSVHPLLDQCRNLGHDLDALEKRVQALSGRQQQSLDSGAGDSSATNTRPFLDAENTSILSEYHVLIDRLRVLKTDPGANDSTNKYHLAALDRKIRRSLNASQQAEAKFARQLGDQQRRQYRIVYPEASDSEIEQLVDLDWGHGDRHIFQDALMNTAEHGRGTAVQSTLSSVRQRHDQIQHILTTMGELRELFQMLDAQVIQQDAAVVQTEEGTAMVDVNLEGGNKHMAEAVKSARAARKKKWICLGISVAILLLIVIIVLIVLRVLHVI